MPTRMNLYQAATEVMQFLMALEDATTQLSIPGAPQGLIKMRVPQINGCA